MKEKTINKFWTSMKTTHWKILLTNTFYYLGFLLLFGVTWLFSTNLINKIGPLLNFYVDIAQPMYKATGNFDPSTLSKVFLFSDMIHSVLNKLILFTIIFIIAFAILRGLKDWILLGKKQAAYIHILIVFAITTFLTFFSILLLLKINKSLGYLLIPLLFLILLKYSLLLTQGVIINKSISKKFLKILIIQLITWIILIILFAIIYYLFSLIFSFLPLLAAILIAIIFFILLISREQYLLTYLMVKNE